MKHFILFIPVFKGVFQNELVLSGDLMFIICQVQFVIVYGFFSSSPLLNYHVPHDTLNNICTLIESLECLGNISGKVWENLTKKKLLNRM